MIAPAADAAVAQTLSVIVVLWLGLFCASSVRAADTPAPAVPPAPAPVSAPVSPAELDRAINRTIHETKYTWRMPRENVVESDQPQGALAQFFEKAGALKISQMVGKALKDRGIGLASYLIN